MALMTDVLIRDIRRRMRGMDRLREPFLLLLSHEMVFLFQTFFNPPVIGRYVHLSQDEKLT